MATFPHLCTDDPPHRAGHVQLDAQHLRRGGRLRQSLVPEQEQDAACQTDRLSREQIP